MCRTQFLVVNAASFHPEFLGKTRGNRDGGFNQVTALLTKYEGANSQKASRFIHGAGTISIKIKFILTY